MTGRTQCILHFVIKRSGIINFTPRPLYGQRDSFRNSLNVCITERVWRWCDAAFRLPETATLPATVNLGSIRYKSALCSFIYGW